MSSSPSLLLRLPAYLPPTLLTALGGFLFGMDTGIIGPVTVMPSFTSTFGSLSPTLHGLVVSAILIPAAITSFLAGRFADKYGRPRVIAVGAGIFAVGAAVEAGAVGRGGEGGAGGGIGMFVAGRALAGIGEGLYLGMLVVYICEISPTAHRGALTTAPQLLITCGLMLGFFTCYGTVRIPSEWSWRLPFLLLAAYSALFAVAAWWGLPPSPRWLKEHGHSREEVRAAWERLGVVEGDRDGEEEEEREEAVVVAGAPAAAVEEGGQVGRGRKKTSQLRDLLAPEARGRFFLAVFLMSMQQLSGIDGVLYYAPLLFQQAGIASTTSTFLASGVSAILIFVVTIPATLYADAWSRRASLILGGFGMSATMFLIGGLYASSSVSSAPGNIGRWIVIPAIYIFTILYCTSWAIGLKLSAAELQPQRTRAAATSIAHGGNWAANFLVAAVTPTLLARASCSAYFLFGACAGLTAAVGWACMPETRGKSLAEIQRVHGTAAAFEEEEQQQQRDNPTNNTMMRLSTLRQSAAAVRKRFGAGEAPVGQRVV